MTSRLKRSKRLEEEEEIPEKPSTTKLLAKGAQRLKPPRPPPRRPPVSRSLTTTTSLTNNGTARQYKGTSELVPKRGVINHAATFDETSTTTRRGANKIMAMKTIPGALPDDLQAPPPLTTFNTRLSPNEHTRLKLEQTVEPEPSKHLYTVSLVASVGGYMVGYDCAILPDVLPLLSQQLHLTTVGQQLAMSLALGTACLSALLAGLLCERLGRRVVMSAAAVLYAAAAVFMALSINHHLLLAARVLAGLALGQYRLN